MVRGARRESRVPDASAGMGVAEYLASRFTYYGGEEWEAHARSGRIELNGIARGPEARVCAGDLVAFAPPDIPEPEVPTDWSVLFEDNAFLFAYKPAGLPSHPAGRYRTRTLWNFLEARQGGIRLVNRLDRETSGIVVAAKSARDAARASRSMAESVWVKEYRAVVEGRFANPVDARGYLVRDGDSPIRKKLKYIAASGPSVDDSPRGGIPVRTRFRPVAQGAELSEVRAELLSGKTHQIRATLEGLGYPLVGDKMYGRDPMAFIRFSEGRLTEEDRGLLRMDRQALHCERVAFSLDEGVTYDVSCPAPPDWPSIK